MSVSTESGIAEGASVVGKYTLSRSFIDQTCWDRPLMLMSIEVMLAASHKLRRRQ